MSPYEIRQGLGFLMKTDIKSSQTTASRSRVQSRALERGARACVRSFMGFRITSHEPLKECQMHLANELNSNWTTSANTVVWDGTIVTSGRAEHVLETA